MARAFLLSDFHHFAHLPHLLIYVIYLVMKYVVISSELVVTLLSMCNKCNKDKQERFRCATIVAALLVFLGTFCCCCCCCCCHCHGHDKKYHFHSKKKRLENLSANLNSFLVKLFFSPKEGIVERFAMYKKDKKDERRVNRDMSVLAVLIMGFGLLSTITTWDTFFLKETYVCTEKPEISCFLKVNHGTQLNLTAVPEHCITNCSEWKSVHGVPFITPRACARGKVIGLSVCCRCCCCCCRCRHKNRQISRFRHLSDL